MKLTYPQRVVDAIIPKLSLLCLLAVGILECTALITPDGLITDALYAGFKYLSLFFLCISVCAFIGRRFPVRLFPAVLMVLWFLFIQWHMAAIGKNAASMGLFVAVYLIAFPFAAVTKDAEKQNGLSLFACVYISFTALLVVLCGLLMFDRLPAVLQDHTYWFGTRLQIVHHPNIVSRTFMIGIAFCFMFYAQVSQKWLKALLLTLVGLLFFAESLTNSRSAVLLTCAMIAAIVFFFIYKGTLKQFAVASAAAIAIVVALFFLSQFIFQWNDNRLNQYYTAAQVPQTATTYAGAVDPLRGSDALPAVSLSAQPMDKSEVDPPARISNGQNSLSKDMSTLNGRTAIWAAVFKSIQEDPSLLLWGCDSTRAVLNVSFFPKHTHNSWLEILLRLGLPGFLLSVVFTGYAVWFALRLLFTQRTSLGMKPICVLTLTLLASGFVEPALFFTYVDFHSHDFTFFLCTGYLMECSRLLRSADNM